MRKKFLEKTEDGKGMRANLDFRLGLLDVVFIDFLILKLAGLVNWSWLFVFLPVLISLGIIAIVAIILAIIVLYNNKKNK